MKSIIKAITSNFEENIWVKYTGIFYRYARWRFPTLLAMTTITGILNIISIAMLLPIKR